MHRHEKLNEENPLFYLYTEENDNFRNPPQNLIIHYHEWKDIKMWNQCIDSKIIAYFIGQEHRSTNFCTLNKRDFLLLPPMS
jgi:hypothetical protein